MPSPVATPTAGPTTDLRQEEQAAIDRIRAGDVGPFGDLYATHRRAATAFARSLTRCASDADDLVAEAFTRILSAITDESATFDRFRPYLFGIIKNLARTNYRSEARIEVRHEVERPGVPTEDEPAEQVLARADRAAAARALQSLPDAWQEVLWNVEVLGVRPRHLAKNDHRSAHAISALAHRAREGLRDAYLATAVTENDSRCLGSSDRLGAYLRGTVGSRERTRIASHLTTCERCQRAIVEVADLASELALHATETKELVNA